MLVTADSWSLFVASWDGNQSCKSMVVGYQPVDDDPEFPPYDAPCLQCVALDELLHPTPKLNEDIPF